MPSFKDLRGVEIIVGDILWHPKRVSSAMWLDAKRVVSIDEKGVKTVPADAAPGYAPRLLNIPRYCVVDLDARKNGFPNEQEVAAENVAAGQYAKAKL
ncbi:hypothetical protein [Taklimakanibacter albus]|uniref:Uncharacterized protein n=1 Tax=Taklimakanibacter albus TaxID=2800327 RepID=A0ACC5RFX1_9HYPH|nr:hypothetical protein [Aestuariivirga sp. YIM B02566]MBK1871552.1 hypothetical protein [Aestuariivirga sp. YIM B02566]